MFRFILITLGALAIYILPVLVGATAVLYFFDSNFLQAVESTTDKKVMLEVSKAWDRKTIAKELEKKGIIKSWMSFYYLSDLGKDGSENKPIVAGEYELSPGQTPKEVIATLLSGKTVVHEINIPPGITVNKASDLLAESGLIKKENAFEALRDQHLMRELGVPAYIPEGYLIAGTYEFSRPIKSRDIVRTIVEIGQQTIEQGIPDWKKRADELGLRPYQVLTLASLIELEAEKAEERPNVAAVYHNRLRIGMHLKSKATLMYGLPSGTVEPDAEDYKAPGPYNTYIATGLPPSPICSPSVESIRAILHPADSDHLYYIKTDQGEYVYASTFKKHKKNLKKLGIVEVE